MNNDWISTEEAARISGYHPNHIRRLIKAGEIQARKWGSALMISRNSVSHYLRKMENRGEKRGPKKRVYP